MLIGTNLLGIIVRGVVTSYKKDEHGNYQIVEDITSSTSIIMTIVSSLVSILYFYALYHYWNFGVVIAALMLMFSRIPDLLFEMRTGEKINFKNMPKKPIDFFSTAVSWLALPVLWYSLCFLN